MNLNPHWGKMWVPNTIFIELITGQHSENILRSTKTAFKGINKSTVSDLHWFHFTAAPDLQPGSDIKR
jgi:hypothetical protein